MQRSSCSMEELPAFHGVQHTVQKGTLIQCTLRVGSVRIYSTFGSPIRSRQWRRRSGRELRLPFVFPGVVWRETALGGNNFRLYLSLAPAAGGCVGGQEGSGVVGSATLGSRVVGRPVVPSSCESAAAASRCCISLPLFSFPPPEWRVGKVSDRP